VVLSSGKWFYPALSGYIRKARFQEKQGVTTGYYWILLDTTGYYWILLDTTGYYWILLDTIGYYLILVDTGGPKPATI
jgi:hypothetical protein